jgi:transcriptional pleiotropic repressor
MTLLDKTRRLNRLLQKEAGHAVSFMDIAGVLKEVINANVYVISRKGKILGYSITNPLATLELNEMIFNERRFPDEFNQILLQINETKTYEQGSLPDVSFPEQIRTALDTKHVTVVPLIGGRERLGTLVLTRLDCSITDDDLILGEYGSTIVAMEILRIKAEEIEVEARSKAVVHVAVGSLSYSELEAVEHIFEELEGKEGLLVASKIADRVGITRSVIVNALRKLESAGVIDTRSLGMKGTFIRILNDHLLKAIENAKVK